MSRQTPTDCPAATGGGEGVSQRGRLAGPGWWAAPWNPQALTPGNAPELWLEVPQGRLSQHLSLQHWFWGPAVLGWGLASATDELGSSPALREMGML